MFIVRILGLVLVPLFLLNCGGEKPQQTPPENACTAETVGERCADGSVYGGQFEGFKDYGKIYTGEGFEDYSASYNLYVTPGHCGSDPQNPLCNSETDSLQWAWSTDRPSYGRTGARYLNDGLTNTTAIMGFYSNPSDAPAAAYCDQLEFSGHDDWYLPSVHELEHLFRNREALGGFNEEGYYWSSTESFEHAARRIRFSETNRYDDQLTRFRYSALKSREHYVRCVRRGPAID